MVLLYRKNKGLLTSLLRLFHDLEYQYFFKKMCFCVNVYEDMWAKEFLSALFREY